MSEKLIEFLDLLNAAMGSPRIIEESMHFLRKHFNLSNCVVFFAGKEHSLFTPQQPLRNAIKLMATHILQDNSFLLVKNPEKEVLFSDIDVSDVKECLLGFPLEKKNSGAIILAGTQDLKPLVPELRVLVDRISIALARAQLFKEVHQSSITDSLTALYNKAYFFESLKNEVERARRNQRPVSLVFFDFDNFKDYNDTKGHIAGDELLKQLGSSIKQNIRGLDIPCRYGGEEFAVILPETSHEHAFATAERLRKTVEKEGSITISLGVVSCLNGSVSAEKMLKEADKALYKAKQHGKNKTINFVIVDKALGVIDVQDASSVGK